MPTVPPIINPLSTIAKFVYNQLTSNTEWSSLSYIPTFYEEMVPIGVDTVKPIAMFCLKNPKTLKGAFGYTLMYCDNYEITSLVSGSDFSLLEPLANIIAQTFDWENQLVDSNGNITTDPTIGRTRTQQVWVDPNNSLIQIMVMCMTLIKHVKYSMFVDGVNYVRMGGVYEIQYYQPDSI